MSNIDAGIKKLDEIVAKYKELKCQEPKALPVLREILLAMKESVPIEQRSITRGEADYIIKQIQILNARIGCIEEKCGCKVKFKEEVLKRIENIENMQKSCKYCESEEGDTEAHNLFMEQKLLKRIEALEHDTSFLKGRNPTNLEPNDKTPYCEYCEKVNCGCNLMSPSPSVVKDKQGEQELEDLINIIIQTEVNERYHNTNTGRSIIKIVREHQPSNTISISRELAEKWIRWYPKGSMAHLKELNDFIENVREKLETK